MPQACDAGSITIERDGLPLGSTTVPAVAAGGEWSLFLERDETLYVSAHSAWPDDPQRSSVRRREGVSAQVHNLSTTPRSVDLLLTQPVSDHELVQVLHTEDSSAGGIEEQPGLWRYRLTLPAASKQTIEHGWILQAEVEAVLNQ